MTPESILGAVGGAAGLAAFFFWMLKTSIQYALKKELAEGESRAARQLEELKVALGRIAQIEQELVGKRERGYTELWGYTDSLNLFGLPEPVDCGDLSEKLKSWYFTHGWTLTQEAKKRYFLVQEALNFARLKSVTLQRPDDEALYGAPELRPLDALRTMRQQRLGVRLPQRNAPYAVSELTSALSTWKSGVIASAGSERSGENGWILLQFLLSAFRTRIVDELGSRAEVERSLGETAHRLPGARTGEQPMARHTRLLRVSYWVAAVADFVIAFLVLVPERMGVDGFVYPMGLMSAVAFSWGVLLLVADRRPLERRWVLPPTILVVFLLGVAGLYAASAGLLPAGRIVGSSVAVVAVLGLLLYAWYRTRGADVR